jgi:Ala-tRNA(Pro) deacylase
MDYCSVYQRRDEAFHPDVALFLLPFLCIIVKVQHEINNLMSDIHEQLRALLDNEGAKYRVVEHEPEGRTEMIAKIRGNRIEQSIKSIVVQVRLNRKENIYCLANVPGDCRIDFQGIKSHFNADSVAFASRDKAQELTGCVVGAIPPFSFSDQLQVLADPLIQQNEEVVFNAGRLDRSIFMKLSDYTRIAKPQLVKIALRG